MNSFDAIKNELTNLAGEGALFTLETPADISHGDYATNITLVLSKEKGVSPKVLAEGFVSVLEGSLKEKGIVSKVEIAGPGFINFFLTDEKIREGNKGREIVTKFSGKNILVEHSSPNLFKPFHIGHLMNNIVGEFVTRSVQLSKANTTALCFPSDISFGVAKAIYVWKKDKAEGVALEIAATERDTLIDYFGNCYVRGVALSKEQPELEEEMRSIARNLYGRVQGEDSDLWHIARDLNTAYFRDVLVSIGSKMGEVIFESDIEDAGKKIVTENTGEGKVFTESEGAIVYIPSEERKDINTSVFINSEGHPTYEAKDVGLIQKKFTGYGDIDVSYFITDAEQSHHFKVVLDAASKISDEWKTWSEKSLHVPHGRMLFKGQKMSSRLGGVPIALDVIAAAEEEVREKSSDKIAHLSEEEKSKLVRDIALSALRIAVLRSKPGININFDPETSLSFEGDSGPYLMYTHARTSSLLDKSGVENPEFGDSQVTSLEREMLHYEEVLKDVIETLSPQKLVSYLFAIAQSFNSYYASTQVLVEGDIAGNSHRLAVVKRVKHILKDGLYVLGCNAPERM
ncbi:MAG: arginine--tRNA ligase [Candidatus Pacebacteria bacterium]|nr:arginine--tRNA ligase [Candidatus Paceibacterota bacterium]